MKESQKEIKEMLENIEYFKGLTSKKDNFEVHQHIFEGCYESFNKHKFYSYALVDAYLKTHKESSLKDI